MKFRRGPADDSYTQVTGEGAPVPWTTGRGLRAHDCCVCGEGIARGEVVCRPLTNGRTRMNRAHPACVRANLVEVKR